MKTRNQGVYKPGAYLYKNQYYLVTPEKNKTKSLSSKSEKTTDLNDIANMINFLIVSQLKSTRKSSPYFRGELYINNKATKLLKNEFNVSKKFENNLNLLKALKIVNFHFSNENDFSYFKKTEFRVKLTNAKKIIHKDQNQKETIFKSKDKLLFDLKIKHDVLQM